MGLREELLMDNMPLKDGCAVYMGDEVYAVIQHDEYDKRQNVILTAHDIRKLAKDLDR